MTWLDIALSIAVLSATATLLVFAIIRGGARKRGLDQKFLDDEQAEAIRRWKDAR